MFRLCRNVGRRLVDVQLVLHKYIIHLVGLELLPWGS